MVVEAATTLAALEAMHRANPCAGGRTPDWFGDLANRLAPHLDHAMRDAGYAVVRLPEADGDDGVNVSWEYASMWHGQNVVSVYVRRNHDYTPAEARAIAADLLAAARAAEAVDL